LNTKESVMTDQQRDELKRLSHEADVPDKSGELLSQEGAQELLMIEKADRRTKIDAKKPLEALPLTAVFYRVVEGAAGVVGAGAVFGAIGADVIDEPTVEPGAVATFGPLHGAHINKIASTAIPAISAIIPRPIPSRRSDWSLLRGFGHHSAFHSSSITQRSNKP
jgi:hypothetical protein